jgi:oligopeptide/dipeptide ABC transporter ATP-binding protein
MAAYPHELSGGMKQRVVIAMSLICQPQLLIADEPTTALDVVVQDQILELIKELQRQFGFALLIISHDMAMIGETCDRVAVMYGGKIMEVGDTDVLFHAAGHPYTRALMEAHPSIHGPRKVIAGLPGNPPDLTDPPPGCRFAPRCPMRQPICDRLEPNLIQLRADHVARCHFAHEVAHLRPPQGVASGD